MFLILLFILICSIIQASEQIFELPDDTPITITFSNDPDDNQKPKESSKKWGEIQHFIAIHDAISSLHRPNQQISVPLLNGTQSAFECLANVINTEKGTPAFQNANFDQLRDSFREKLPAQKCSITKLIKDLNFLGNTYTQAKSVVASLYAENLQHNVPSVVLDEELTKYTAGWLLHDLITNPNIKGVKRETAIHKLAYKSCAFTDDGAAWLSRETNEPRSDFFYYNLVDDTLSLITSQAPFGRNRVAADDKNLYCICNWRDNHNNTHQLTAYIFDTTQPKHILKNKTEFNLQGTFHDINLVYDKDNKSFILIAINVLNKQFSFYTLPLDNNTQGIIANRLTTQTTTIDLHNESNNLLHQGSSQLGNTWKCFDGKLVRTQRYLNNGIIETNLIICNLATQHIEYQGNFDIYMQQKDKTFSVMKYYAENDYYEPIISHQCIARHPLIPNYETIMSQRATNIEIEKEVEGLDAIMFDGEHMRYCIEKKRIAIPDKLIFYDLLPYELNAAIHFLSKNQDNLILNAWYIYHAALKTNMWKNIDQATTDQIAAEIKKWYPLPITKSQQKGLGGITSMLKQNLGALWERSKKAANYTYLMYGRTFKTAAIAAGGTALVLYLISLLGKNAVSKQINYSKPVTINPGQSLQITRPGSNTPITIINRSGAPLTGTPASILHKMTTMPPAAQPAR